MKHCVLLTVAVTLGLGFPIAAGATSYHQIASSEGGGGTFVDADSIQRVGSYMRADVFVRDHIAAYNLTTHVRKTIEFDCSGRRSRMIRSVQFDSRGKKIGESIDFHGFSNDVPDNQKLAIESAAGDHALRDPVEGWVLNFVCGSKDDRSRYPEVGKLP